MMRAILHSTEALTWALAPTPRPGPGEVRIRVRATAINRADLLQRAGRYPAPPGKSPILGLEASGEIDAVGEGVSAWRLGDRVCALLAGGGYAEYVACPERHLLPIPDSLSFEQAAALPEVIATAFLNLVIEGTLRPGERVLIHAGASGVGTCAVQLCRARGNPCYVTVGSNDKIERCIELGAAGGANRRVGRWADSASAWAPEGFDLILDPVGAAYLDDNIRVLRTDGRLVLIGLMGGRSAPVDLGRILTKRLRVIGSVLRSRNDAFKAELIRRIHSEVWPLVGDGTIRPVIDRVMSIVDAEHGFEALQSDDTVGKVVLTLP